MKFIEIHFYCSLCFSGVPVLYTVFIVKSMGPFRILLAGVKFRGGGGHLRYKCTIHLIIIKYMYMYCITNTQ